MIASALALWLPWFPATRTYVFYGAPIVPLLAIGVVVAIDDVVPPRHRRITVSVLLIAAGTLFALTRTTVPWAA